METICQHLQAARALVQDGSPTALILDGLIAQHCGEGDGGATASGGPGPTTPPIRNPHP